MEVESTKIHFVIFPILHTNYSAVVNRKQNMSLLSLNKLFKCLEWTLFLGIGAISVLFIFHGEEIEQFRSKATGFKLKELPITERPAITICPYSETEKYEYNIDFSIAIGYTILKLGKLGIIKNSIIIGM